MAKLFSPPPLRRSLPPHVAPSYGNENYNYNYNENYNDYNGTPVYDVPKGITFAKSPKNMYKPGFKANDPKNAAAAARRAATLASFPNPDRPAVLGGAGGVAVGGAGGGGACAGAGAGAISKNTPRPTILTNNNGANNGANSPFLPPIPEGNEENGNNNAAYNAAYHPKDILSPIPEGNEENGNQNGGRRSRRSRRHRRTARRRTARRRTLK
jgi:hypothetical protein